MLILNKRISLIVYILTLCFITGILIACNKPISDNNDNTAETETDAGSEAVETDYISTIQEILAPPAATMNETQVIENHDKLTIYSDDLKWYINEDIISLKFAEMYISASVKRTDPKYSQLRDPEIRLIHLIGANGTKEINTVIDKIITEPYSEYISQIQSGDYTSDNLFVCQSYAVVYDNIAVIEISYFVYSGTAATEADSENIVFFYDYITDKVLTIPDILEVVGTDDTVFINVLNTYANQFNQTPKTYTQENIKWLLPTETGLTVNMYIEEYSTYTETFTIPYTAFDLDY